MKEPIHTTIPGLSLRRKGGGELDLFLDNDPSKTLAGFTRLFHREQYGQMEFQFFLGNGFRLWHNEYDLTERLEGEASSDTSFFELQIPLQGTASHWWDKKKETRRLEHQFSLDYVPYINDYTTFHARHLCATLDIHCDFSFLAAFVHEYPIVGDFLASIKREPAHLFNNAVRFLSPDMKRLVHDILHFAGPDEFAHRYYEERVTLLLHAVFSRATTMKSQYSHRKYLEAAVSARRHIESHPEVVHSAKSLSAYTGIEISLLHKIFKDYHGTTLFDFSQELRLEHAKSLLAHTSLYIHEIATCCGYPDHPNFTAAFRKRFGFRPQQYRDALANTGLKNKTRNS